MLSALSEAKASIQRTDPISCKTCQKHASTPIKKDKNNEPVQIRIGLKYRQHARRGKESPNAAQRKHQQHRGDLPYGL